MYAIRSYYDSDVDLFVFDGAAGTSIRVNMAGLPANLDSRIPIRDPAGQSLANKACSTPSNSSTCSVSVDLDLSSTGRYVIAVSDFGLDDSGDYSLT